MSQVEARRGIHKPEFQEKLDPQDYVFVAGNGNLPLANEVADLLGLPIQTPIGSFADGETSIHYPSSPNFTDREALIFDTHPTGGQNNAIVGGMAVIDGILRSGPARMTQIIPYMAYGRQDRKTGPGEPNMAAFMYKLYEWQGISRIMTIDPHNEASPGAVNKPVDILPGWYPLRQAITQHMEKLKNAGVFETASVDIFMSPDAGRFKQIEKDSHTYPGYPSLAQMLKVRGHNGITNHGFVTEIPFKQKVVLITDDMIASGGTMLEAVHIAKNQGALYVMIAATHGVFTGNYRQVLLNPNIDHIFVTNTLDQTHLPDELLGKITVVSVGPMIAQAILANRNRVSLQELFYKKG